MFRRPGLPLATTTILASAALTVVATDSSAVARTGAAEPAEPAKPAPRTSPANATPPTANAANVANAAAPTVARRKATAVAHRGASAYAPENTIAAFRLARKQRADMFELDVQETKDHKLVVLHDTTLGRTTNVESVYPGKGPWKVSSFTLAQVRRLDAGSWFGKRFKGERIPTLGEALRAMNGAGIGLLLEIKSPSLYPGIERRIAAELRRNPAWLRPDPRERRLAVQSFDWNSVRRFHGVLPAVPTGLLGTPKTSELKGLARFADQINPTHTTLTAAYVKRVHALGMDAFTWTVDDPAAMRRALRLGVDGVISNKPDVLRRVVDGGGTRADAA